MSDSAKNRQAHLGVMLYRGGGYLGAWRRPEAIADPLDLGLWQRIARTAEDGKLDCLFLSDQVSVWPFSPEALARTAWATAWEPMTILSALAVTTERIGLLATMTTSFSLPYTAARQFASLDLISGGRAGWNIVTSASEAQARNYGGDPLADHDERYVRAQEFVDVVRGLWDSWEDDAFLFDKESGIYFDAEKLHTLDHAGKYFSVAGPLNVPRSPQGYPVVVQAGASPVGRAFAARNAETIFTLQAQIDLARDFYAETKQAVADNGRDPEHVKVLPGLAPVIAATDEEAQAKLERLQSYLDPIVGRAQVENFLGMSMSSYPLDGPVPDVPLANNQGRQRYLLDKAREENLTLRELFGSFSGAGLFAGSPTTIADRIEEWVTTGAADGFMISPPYLPDGLEEFCELVVPELQRRGIFRSEYEGTTLRDHLGLPYPRISRERVSA